MKIFHSRKQMLAFFMPGFLCGILYMNLTAQNSVTDPGIFGESFLRQYEAAEVAAGIYLFYLVRMRITPFLMLIGLSFTRMRKITAGAFLIWTGFSCGLILSMSVMEMGIKGIALCIAGVLPQFLLYIPSYLVILWYCWVYPQNRWNREKTIFVVATMVAGILLEAYVNPVLVKGVLHLIR